MKLRRLFPDAALRPLSAFCLHPDRCRPGLRPRGRNDSLRPLRRLRSRLQDLGVPDDPVRVRLLTVSDFDYKPRALVRALRRHAVRFGAGGRRERFGCHHARRHDRHGRPAVRDRIQESVAAGEDVAAQLLVEAPRPVQPPGEERLAVGRRLPRELLAVLLGGYLVEVFSGEEARVGKEALVDGTELVDAELGVGDAAAGSFLLFGSVSRACPGRRSADTPECTSRPGSGSRH